MKIGDLVKSTRFATNHGLGIIVRVCMFTTEAATYHILWNNGDLAWQTPRQLELVSENR